MEKLYCPVRGEWVADQPEERVRQHLLSWMMKDLGYPLAYLAVEKALDKLPHTTAKKVPDCRADIICFSKNIHPAHELYPLLLIECKAAVPLNERVLRQVAGYNHFIGAYFIAVANEKKLLTGWYDSAKNDYQFMEGLPPYSQLVSKIPHSSITT